MDLVFPAIDDKAIIILAIIVIVLVIVSVAAFRRGGSAD
jgi:hypothetical protein